MDGRSESFERYQVEQLAAKRELILKAHDAAGPFICGLAEFDCVFTATYDPRKRNGAIERVLGVDICPRVSRWKALRDGEKLWRFAVALVGRPVEAVICVEPHLDTSYHLHGVLRLGSGRAAYRGALTWWWSENFGHCRFAVPRSGAGVSRYVGKHLAGPMSDLWFSPSLHGPACLSEGA